MPRKIKDPAEVAGVLPLDDTELSVEEVAGKFWKEYWQSVVNVQLLEAPREQYYFPIEDIFASWDPLHPNQLGIHAHLNIEPHEILNKRLPIAQGFGTIHTAVELTIKKTSHMEIGVENFLAARGMLLLAPTLLLPDSVLPLDIHYYYVGGLIYLNQHVKVAVLVERTPEHAL